MRIRLRTRGWRSRGVCIAVAVVLLPTLLGIIGLSVDLGIVELARCHLQTVADAAALAGARQLNDPNRLNPGFNVGNDMPNVRMQVVAIGQRNPVLGQPSVINDNPNNDPSGDFVVGYKDLTVKGSPLLSGASYTNQYNSVQVTAKRTSDHGGVVPTFFGGLLWSGGTPVSVTSTATVQNYSVKGFATTPGGRYTTLIPIALSATTWNAMVARQTTDNYTFNQGGSGQVQGGPDGIYESSLYPAGSGSGNWGTVRIGVNNNGTSYLANQIQYGVTTDQIAVTAGSSGYLQANPTLNLPGNPGVSLGLKPALASLIGKTVIVPIYDPNQSSGNGSNFNYVILGFAPVVVLNTTFSGVNSNVIVQPSISTDPSALIGAQQSSWMAGGVVRLHLSQ